MTAHEKTALPRPYYSGAGATLYLGDSAAVLRDMHGESVHMCVTSPPYWALRTYGVEGEMGNEPTLDAYLAGMVEVFREVRRVLRTDGVCFINMGDSYSGGTQGGSDSPRCDGGQDRLRDLHRTQGALKTRGLPPKNLCMVPSRLALALQADGWYLRSMIPWLKRSSMPESCRDRPSNALEYVFLLTKSERYFYDGEAVRLGVTGNAHARGNGVNPKCSTWKMPDGWDTGEGEGGHGTVHKRGRSSGPIPYADRDPEAEGAQSRHGCTLEENAPRGGRNRRNSDWYFDSLDLAIEQARSELDYLKELRAKGGPVVFDGEIAALDVNPAGFSGAHFATYPPKLIEPCILAGTSAKGACAKCGSPWQRVVNKPKPPKSVYTKRHAPEDGLVHSGSVVDGEYRGHGQKLQDWLNAHPTQTLGFRPTCRCECSAPPIPCVILDPFLGSGTTALVCASLGRACIGIDLNADYLSMAVESLRLGRRPRVVTPPPGQLELTGKKGEN